MQSSPSEAGRAASRTHSDAVTPGDAADATVHSIVAAQPDAEAGANAESTPTMVLRLHIGCRVIGPVLVVIGVALAGAGLLPALVLVPIGLAFLPTVWARLEVGELSIRRRRWRGGWTRVPTDSVDTLRLRRIPFPVLGWMKRGHRIGRFWSVPLTIRLQHEENVLVELRCIWWSGWRELARFTASQPGMDLDLRTQGRLARYVGPLAWATSYEA